VSSLCLACLEIDEGTSFGSDTEENSDDEPDPEVVDKEDDDDKQVHPQSHGKGLMFAGYGGKGLMVASHLPLLHGDPDGIVLPEEAKEEAADNEVVVYPLKSTKQEDYKHVEHPHFNRECAIFMRQFITLFFPKKHFPSASCSITMNL
jgi:hypothetical protein